MSSTLKYRIGLMLVIFSFLLALNPFILLYVLPFYAVGVILISLSKKSVLVKLAWALVPVMLWRPGVELFILSYVAMEERTKPKYDFVFPDDFTGRAVIVENMPCGVSGVQKNGRIVLLFPKNGTLLYSGRIRSSYLDEGYYVVDSKGSMDRIFNFNISSSEADSIRSTDKGVRFDHSGVSNLYLPDRFIYTYVVMTVGSRNGIEHGDAVLEMSEVEELVSNCIKNQKRQ